MAFSSLLWLSNTYKFRAPSPFPTMMFIHLGKQPGLWVLFGTAFRRRKNLKRYDESLVFGYFATARSIGAGTSGNLVGMYRRAHLVGRHFYSLCRHLPAGFCTKDAVVDPGTAKNFAFVSRGNLAISSRFDFLGKLAVSSFRDTPRGNI